MSQIFSQGYAVVVGVGADLPVTVTDATVIASFLCDLSRCAYQQDRVRLLTETSAHRENVLASLDWLAREANQESTAIVYFSGHGMQTPDYYLIPNGYDPENLPHTAISGKEFTEKLRAIQARKLVVLLDCCHAGGLAEAKAKAKPWVKSPLPPSIIEQLGSGGGRVVIASSRQSEISLTGEPYSVFTMAVLEALAGYGAFEYDGYAHVLDLAMWVGRKVPDRTEDSQHPIIKVSNLEDNFPLAWYSAGEKEICPLQNWGEDAPSGPSGQNAGEIAPLLEELREEHSVPFVNRDDEKKMILSSIAPAYYILDAPAGYGKTKLLMQLESSFKELNWNCCYVSIDESHTTVSLAKSVAEKFGITLPQPDRPYGALLGRELKNKWLGGRGKGIILLIDFDKRPSLTLLQDLLRNFIPDIQKCLRDLPGFNKNHNLFRVIIAGRNLSTYRHWEEEEYPELVSTQYLKLSPFSFNVIRKSAANYLPDEYRESIDQLSAHLFFLTGGHPGCMAHILEMYRDLQIATDHLIDHFGRMIWQDVVRKYVEIIRDEISSNPKNLYKVLEQVSVFRFVDVGILEDLHQDLISANYDKIQLADELTTTYLFERDGRYLKDDITRRLLTIQLRNEAPDEFKRRCDFAKDICAVRLRKRAHRPEKWVVEYLYQSLQSHSNNIQTPRQRTTIRQIFFKEINKVLQIFASDERNEPREDWPEMREDLLQEVKKDWEFQFTINYYLRKDYYNEEPYEEMLRQIK